MRGKRKKFLFLFNFCWSCKSWQKMQFVAPQLLAKILKKTGLLVVFFSKKLFKFLLETNLFWIRPLERISDLEVKDIRRKFLRPLCQSLPENWFCLILLRNTRPVKNRRIVDGCKNQKIVSRSLLGSKHHKIVKLHYYMYWRF